MSSTMIIITEKFYFVNTFFEKILFFSKKLYSAIITATDGILCL